MPPTPCNCPVRRRWKAAAATERGRDELEDERNTSHAPVISAESSRVTVRVIPTNEELMIARSVSRLLCLDTGATEREP